MQDCTQLIHTLPGRNKNTTPSKLWVPKPVMIARMPAPVDMETSEIIVAPKTELVLPCPVDMETGIVMATPADMPVNDEDAARKLIEKQNAA